MRGEEVSFMERGMIYIIAGVTVGLVVGAILAYVLLVPSQPPYYYDSDNYPRDSDNYPRGSGMGGGGPMMGWQSDDRYYSDYGDNRYYPPGCCQGPENFSSNGESIYFTGINLQGERIPFNGGPNWLYQHGGSCVNCHHHTPEYTLILLMGI